MGVFLNWEDGRVVRGPLQNPETIHDELEFALKRFADQGGLEEDDEAR
ncbi:MAG: hypothetical protein U0271_22985 [Polyangiaceae bacterium]